MRYTWLVADQPALPRALVVGAGIAGMQAALDIANAGYPVTLVERRPSIGGTMAQLSETFPTLDCSQCILTPRTVEVARHPNITLLAYSEIVSVTPINLPTANLPTYHIRMRQKPRYVDWDACTGCGMCQAKCPSRVDSEFERGLGKRKAIYTLSPQAVPNKPVIDREHCLFFQKNKCRACEKTCPAGAIAFDQQETWIEEQVNAIILAPGCDLYGLERMAEYGGGRLPDVIDTLAFERLLSASGPTAGRVLRPSDGKVPREVVFIQCAGSRDAQKHMPYCSKVCCMVAAKQAVLYRHRVHDGQAYVFYIDIRAAGKRYDEFTQRAMEQEGVVYLRGKVSRLFHVPSSLARGGQVMVWGADTLSGRQVQIAADLVVLAPALVPRPETRRLAEIVGAPVDEHGWLAPRDPNAYPVETIQPGVFLAGAGCGPMDIPETVAHASAAAAQALKAFAREAR